MCTLRAYLRHRATLLEHRATHIQHMPRALQQMSGAPASAKSPPCAKGDQTRLDAHAIACVINPHLKFQSSSLFSL
jgi:hypothetical protein